MLTRLKVDTSNFYPNIFTKVDSYSVKQQRRNFLLLGAELVASVIVAVAGYLAYWCTSASIVQMIALILLLIFAVIGHLSHYESRWYTSRSIAESIKTIIWRYSMRAEPFDGNNGHEDRELFHKRISTIIKSSDSFTKAFSWDDEAEVITEAMVKMREASEEHRMKFYERHRISDQQRWYSAKASHAKKCKNICFSTVIVLIVAAIALCALELFQSGVMHLPIEAIVLMITSILTWMESKRYSELATSYNQTLLDIKLLHSEFFDSIESNGLSETIADAEAAFSREHAQWISRKDG